VLTVQCERCGARYETDLTPAAIERVPRCRVCGRRALVVVEDEEAASGPSS
jgi:NAD-dependent SIR2 family protein deacetylase